MPPRAPERSRSKPPCVNERGIDVSTGERKRFSPAILPPWCRKSPKSSEVLPLLYLHGLSSGDLEGPGRGLSRLPASEVLGSQIGQRAQRSAEAGPARRPHGASGHLQRRGPRTRAEGCHLVRARLRREGAQGPKKIIHDTAELLAFQDFPAEHWIHLCTTNPIESTFATVRQAAVRMSRPSTPA